MRREDILDFIAIASVMIVTLAMFGAFGDGALL